MRFLQPERLFNLLNRICNMVKMFLNSKGSIFMLSLYFLKYKKFREFIKRLLVATILFMAFIANFNLDLTSVEIKKNITVGISRMLLFFVFLAIWKYKRDYPILFGIAWFSIPRFCFFFFRIIYLFLDFISSKIFVNNELLLQSKENSKFEYDKCSICLEENCDYIADCEHNFHKECLENWIMIKNECPVCKSKIKYNLSFKHQLQNYFILSYPEWRERMGILISNWWYQQILYLN
eukprot:TRINITY_DN6613_c0_g1_i1.p1 TRINITY_DN6613_c0_g1~~TRINITY_DN6613_c0_g1_i1.p1  ORF type:complete len:247 (-),score=24.97 TRINITY_DN6613_c0_g1_i1:112-819(-)